MVRSTKHVRFPIDWVEGDIATDDNSSPGSYITSVAQAKRIMAKIAEVVPVNAPANEMIKIVADQVASLKEDVEVANVAPSIEALQVALEMFGWER